MTAHVQDVAQFIINNSGPGLTTKKLQKLCYYSKAWSLAQRDSPIFPEVFEAWKDGPVSRDLYAHHRQAYHVNRDVVIGNVANLSAEDMRLVQAVIDSYGTMSGDQLGAQTHAEDPWADARGNLPDGASSEAVIPDQAIKRCFVKKQLRGQIPLNGPSHGRFQPSPLDKPLASVMEAQLTRWSGVNRLLADR